MSIQIKHGGKTYTVQTDDPEVASRSVEKHLAQQKAQRPRTFGQNAKDFTGRVVDNLIPNFGDEIAAIPDAAMAAVRGRPVGSAFKRGQREFKSNQADFAKRQPKLAGTATATGIIGSFALPAGAVIKGASLASKAAAGAKSGAIWGAVSGAGEGEGLDLGRRAGNAAASSAVGATFGAGTPYVLRGAQVAGQAARSSVPFVDNIAQSVGNAGRDVRRAAGNAVDRMLPAVPPSIRQRLPSAPTEPKTPPTPHGVQVANRMALQRMNEGNIERGMVNSAPTPASPETIAAAVNESNQRGVPAMIGDVSLPMADLTGWASRGAGPAQTMIREKLRERQADAGNRVQQHVRDTFQTTASPRQYLGNLQEETRRAAGPAYEEAYAQPMQINREIQGYMETPAFQGALPQAYTNIRNQIDPETLRPKSPEAMGMRHIWRTPDDPNVPAPALDPSQHRPYFQHPQEGHVQVGPDLSMEGFDQTVRAMRQKARDGMEVNQLTQERRDTTNTIHVNQAATNLRQLLMDQNEPYRRAVTEYGDNIAMQEAFENGLGFAKSGVTGDALQQLRQDMPNAAGNPWEVGAGTAMVDAASQFSSAKGTGNVANHVRQMMGDQPKQEAIGQITGNTGQVRELQERLADEMRAFRTYHAAEQGSQTAPRQAIDDEINDGVGFSKGGGIADRLIDFVTSKTAPAYRQTVKNRIGEIVTAQDAQSVQEVMAALQRQVQTDASFAKLLGEAGLSLSDLYARNIAPTNPVPED